MRFWNNYIALKELTDLSFYLIVILFIPFLTLIRFYSITDLILGFAAMLFVIIFMVIDTRRVKLFTKQLRGNKNG